MSLSDPSSANLVDKAFAITQIRWLERVVIFAVLATLSAAYLRAALTISSHTYLWMDEVLAVLAAQEPTARLVLHEIWTGTDFSPPTYHLLLHTLAWLAGPVNSALVWRLPSIFALLATAYCVYALLRTSLSRLAAMIGFALVLSLGLFDFAVQVRPYALLTLAFATSLLFWVRMEDTQAPLRLALLLWLSLAACLSLHFYGIIEVVVVGFAELVYLLTRRHLRWAVWLTLLLLLPIEAALYPLAVHLSLVNAGDNLSSAYYGKPTLGRFIGSTIDVVGGGRFGLMLLLAGFATAAIAHQTRRSGPQPPPLITAEVLPALNIVILALCALPPVAFSFSFFVTKSFSTRYMVAAALLPAIAAPCLLDRLQGRRLVAFTLAALAFFDMLMLHRRASGEVAMTDALSVLAEARQGLPIVVGEGQLYIELMQAADTGTKHSLVFLKTPRGVVSPDPTNENEVVRLATLHDDYQVSDQRPFLDRTPRFLVLARPGATMDTTTPSLLQQRLLEGPVMQRANTLLFNAVASVPPVYGVVDQANRHQSR